MQRLAGLDHMFLAMDTQTTNSIVNGFVQFHTPKPGQPVPDAAFMRGRIAERMEYIPPFHQKIVEVPLGLDHHYLAEDGHVDLNKHVVTVKLPPPGNARQLADEISRICQTELDMTKPPWMMYVFEGLENGGVALLNRLHHGVVDGSSMPRLWDILSDDPQEPLEHTHHYNDWPEPIGGRAEMVTRAAWSAAMTPVKWAKVAALLSKWLVQRFPEDGLTTLPATAARFTPGKPGQPLRDLLNIRQRRAGRPELAAYVPEVLAPQPFFNGRITAQRHFAFSEMPLGDVKAAAKANGSTLNNMVIAITAGAVRHWMLDNGGDVSQPLVVNCPVSLRDGSERDFWANHVSMMFARYPVHITDPIERLHYVNDQMTSAKQNFDALPLKYTRQMSEAFPRDLFVPMFQALTRLPHWASRTNFNVVVSNVKGTNKPQYLNGLRIRGFWPASFLIPGGGLNITLQSHEDTICFGFMGDPNQVRDLWPLTEYMKEEVQRYLELHGQTSAKDAKPASERKTLRSTENRSVRIVG